MSRKFQIVSVELVQLNGVSKVYYLRCFIHPQKK